MTTHVKRELFSPVDAAWLRMDRPTNTMMITGVMMFDQPLDLARVKETMKTRLLTHERFRWRLRESPLRMTLPHWEEDKHFDINAHVQRVALPAPGDTATLQELVSNLMSTPLDYNRPLWHFYVVENFGEGGAIIGRLHHCIGDGVALVQVLLGMTDEEPNPLPERRKARELLAESLVAPMKPGASGIGKLAGSILRESRETFTRPSHALELAHSGQALASQWAKQGTDVVAAAGKLLLTLPDRKTVFRGSCGVSKRAAWSEPFPLEEVKAIGRQLGGTANDVLLAAISGALRRYMEGVGEPTAGVEINAMVPVNLRQPHEMGKLGNRFGLVILTLPVGTRDPVDRLAIMKKRMDDIKHTPEALVAFAILNTMGATPVDVERLMIDFFTTKTTAVMTNVPGPKEPLYLAGSRMNNLMFWVPAAGNCGMGISIMSYAGNIMVGIMTDVCLVSDPMAIAENFNVELRSMREWLVPATQAVEADAAASAPEPVAEIDGEATQVAAVVSEEGVSSKVSDEIEAAEELGVIAAEPGHNGKTSSRKRHNRKVTDEVTEDVPEEVSGQE